MTQPFSAAHGHGLIVIDALVGSGLTFQPQTLIEWHDGYFTRVEQVSDSTMLDGVPRLSGVAIPGLIDAHVHLALDGTPDVVSSLGTLAPDQIEKRLVASATSYLSAGITTVRDLGAPAGYLARMVANGVLTPPHSPRVLAAQAISSPTGHGNFIARHAETLGEYRTIIDSLDPIEHPFLKLFASGGVITSGSNPEAIQMPAKLLRDVTSYAHDKGFKVASHAHSHASIVNCVAAGVDTIEHFSYLDDNLASLVADSSSYLVSTYIATSRFANSPARAGAEPEALEKILRHDAIEAAALRVAAKISEKVIAGSDSGTILNPHPFAIHETGQLLVAAGFTDHNALISMTSRSAIALGIEGGHIGQGMPADLVVCDTNPAISITALSTINHVLVAGHHIAS
jgi:imidazolonepropionase-like amidohydrolase